MASSVDIIINAVDNTKGAMNSVSSGFSKVKSAAALLAATVAGVSLAIEKAAKSFTDYSDQVKAVSRVTGATAEESSRLIQVADDLFISYENLSVAMKMAVKAGIEPNIDSLARLSDQYLALTPGLERSTFLLEKFGRGGLEMGKMMEVGAEGLRKMAAATPSGLILSPQDVATADKLKIAFDGLGDSVKAFSLKMVSDAAPALIEFIGHLNNLISEMDKSYDIWGENIQQIEHYVSITEHNREITARAIELFKEQNKGLNNSWEAWQKLTPQMQAAYIEQAKLSSETENLNGKLHTLPGTLTEAGIAARDAAQGVQDMADAMSATDQFNFVMTFQAQFTGFDQKRDEILAKMTELKNKILAIQAEMAAGTKRKSEGISEVEDLQNQISGLTGDLTKNQEEWKQWQKQTAFSLISTQLLAKGVDLGKIFDIGAKMGVLDPDVVAAAKDVLTSVSDIVSEVDADGITKVADKLKYIVSLDNTTVTITVNEITTGSSQGGYASGGSFDVPYGFPNDSYKIGLSSGEHVDISTPGQTATNSTTTTTNNYYISKATLMLERGYENEIIARLTE